MKMHTFLLSSRALAVLVGAAMALALLLFVTGVLVGAGIGSTPVPPRVAGFMAALPVGDTSSPRPPATNAIQPAAPDPADWPFGASATPRSIDTAPPPPVAAPVQPAPAKPDSASARPTTRRSALMGVALVTPPPQPAATSSDTTLFTVQVGAFRVERNARALAERLGRAGYRATVLARDDEGRPLHVVRVGRIVGRDEAARIAGRLSDAERLVAVVVTDFRDDRSRPSPARRLR